MQMSVSYCSFGGRMLYENRGGVESSYARDPLGNTTALLDMNGNQTDSWTYWPYGEVQSHIGSSVTPFTFVGTLGYFVDFANMLYVKARHLKSELTRWMTAVDEIRKSETETNYGYCYNSPNLFVDPLGESPASAIRDACKVALDACLDIVQKQWNRCSAKAVATWSQDILACNLLPLSLLKNCVAQANAILSAKIAACDKRFSPLQGACFEAYQACLDGRAAALAAVCYSVAAVGMYGIYRCSRAACGAALLPESGGASGILIFAP